MGRLIHLVLLAAAACERAPEAAPPAKEVVAPANEVVIAPAAAAPVVWTMNPEDVCSWKTTRGGKRGPGSFAASGNMPDPVLHFNDRAFLEISMEDRPMATLRADGDDRRSVRLQSWSSHDHWNPQEAVNASLGMYLTAAARRALGGAKRIELIIDGRTLLDLPMENFPSQAELDECFHPDAGPEADGEHEE